MAKVLVIDDDAEMVDMIKEWLDNEHYIVETVYSGREADDYLYQYKYDVIVLDWQLPDREGIDICREFRRKNGRTPILMLTGRNTIDFKTEGLDAGADDYLTKPFEFKEFSARLRALLRRSPQLTDNVLQMGLLVLDPKTHSATYDGREMKLFPKDFAVLEFLMRNHDQFFDTEALLNHIWKAEDGVGLESVRQTIRRLRIQLGEDGESMLETARGVGYRLHLPRGSSG